MKQVDKFWTWKRIKTLTVFIGFGFLLYTIVYKAEEKAIEKLDALTIVETGEDIVNIVTVDNSKRVGWEAMSDSLLFWDYSADDVFRVEFTEMPGMADGHIIWNTMGDGDIIQLIWDEQDQEWHEISRITQ